MEKQLSPLRPYSEIPGNTGPFYLFEHNLEVVKCVSTRGHSYIFWVRYGNLNGYFSNPTHFSILLPILV